MENKNKKIQFEGGRIGWYESPIKNHGGVSQYIANEKFITSKTILKGEYEIKKNSKHKSILDYINDFKCKDMR